MMIPKTTPLYWYLMSFVEEDKGVPVYRSTTVGFLTPEVTGVRISGTKLLAKCSTNAVVLSVSFLGVMDQDTFNRGMENYGKGAVLH